MTTRVLFINRSYWPDTEATGQLLTELCEGLADEFAVTVLAGRPNTVVGEAAGWAACAEHHGVRIIRVPHTRFGKRSTILKAINFVTFAVMAFLRCAWLPRDSRPDIVVVETDPFLLPFVGASVRWRYGSRLVCYLQDIYPDVAVAVGKIRPSWSIRRLRSMLFRVYRKADQVVVLSRDMRALLAESSVPEDKVVIIPNWVDTENIVPVKAAENPARADFGLAPDSVAVMYSGNIGLTQRLDVLVDAAKAMQDESHIRFVIVGDGASRRELEEQASGLGNLAFFGYQPKNRLAQSLSAGDIHFVPLQAQLAACLMPSKLYGILAVGRAIVTTAPHGSELHQIVVEHDLGLVVPPDDPTALQAAIAELAADDTRRAEMGRRGRSLCEQRFRRCHAVRDFAAVLRETAAVQADVQMAVTGA